MATEEGKSLRDLLQSIAACAYEDHGPAFMALLISESDGSIDIIKYDRDIPHAAATWLTWCDADMRLINEPTRFIEDIALAAQVADRRKAWTH